MILRSLILCAALSLAACSTQERIDTTAFEPQADANTFRYRAYADASVRLDVPWAEEYRMDMLKEWLELNHKCPDGFTITSRKPVKKSEGIFADIYDIYYEGRCKPSQAT
jgi:hypothetical protein